MVNVTEDRKIESKKVLFLITKSNWGGAQRYVYDLATNLDPDQFEPVVALGGTGTLKEMLEHAGVRVITIDSLQRDFSLKKELLFGKELWNILKTEKPDIFHVNSSKAGGVGTFLGRVRFVPRVIFTAHGWAFNEDRPWWQKELIKFFHWLTVMFSHQTIAVSSGMVGQMDWPFAKKKMHVINPGRSIGVMYGKQEAREKIIERMPELEQYKTAPWILTIAELHPIKRLDVLVESLREVTQKHPKVRSVIIGEGEMRTQLQKQIEQLELTSHVFLTGSITEAARFLKAGNLFVLPSKSESYGYVLHEAGLAGLPVVATNVGGIPDIISDRKSGRLVPPDNVGELSKVITNYFDAPKYWIERQEALKGAMTARSIELMCRKTTFIYLL